MAIKDVFKGFFVIDDEDNENEVYSSEDTREERLRAQSVQQQTAPAPVKQIKTEKRVVKPNVVNIKPEPVSASSKMCLFEPRVFSDTQDIADELKNRRATLVNLQRIDKISAKRIIDFLSGTVYAIGGDIQRIGQDIFLCTPDNVEVAGSITEMLDAPEEEE